MCIGLIGKYIFDERPSGGQERGTDAPLLGWHFLSNSTCLIRPRLFYASFNQCQGSPRFATFLATVEEHLR